LVQAAQQPHHGLAHVREQRVDEASGKDRDTHSDRLTG